MSHQDIAAYLSYMAVLVTCAGYLRTSDNFLRGAMALSSALLSIHFAILLLWVPCISLLINAIRNQVSRSQKGFRWFIIFAVIQVAVSAGFFREAKDLLPIVASLLSGYAVFCASGLVLRILMFSCTFLWLLHNIFYAAPGAVILDLLGLGTNMYGMYKIYSLSKNK